MFQRVLLVQQQVFFLDSGLCVSCEYSGFIHFSHLFFADPEFESVEPIVFHRLAIFLVFWVHKFRVFAAPKKALEVIVAQGAFRELLAGVLALREVLEVQGEASREVCFDALDLLENVGLWDGGRAFFPLEGGADGADGLVVVIEEGGEEGGEVFV